MNIKDLTKKGEYRKGSAEYDYLSSLSNFDFSQVCCDLYDLGYELTYDVIGDYFQVVWGKNNQNLVI